MYFYREPETAMRTSYLRKLKKLSFSLGDRAVDSNTFHCSLEDLFKEDEESKGHVIEIMKSRVICVVDIIHLLNKVRIYLFIYSLLKLTFTLE